MAKRTRLFYITKRCIPGSKEPNYITNGQLTKAEAKRKEKPICGTNYVTGFATEAEYHKAISDLEVKGITCYDSVKSAALEEKGDWMRIYLLLLEYGLSLFEPDGKAVDAGVDCLIGLRAYFESTGAPGRAEHVNSFIQAYEKRWPRPKPFLTKT